VETIETTIFWDTTSCNRLSEERIAYIFRVEKYAKEVTDKKQITKSSLRVACFACSSTPNVEAMGSSETSVNCYRTTGRSNPEESTLQSLYSSVGKAKCYGLDGPGSIHPVGIGGSFPRGKAVRARS
jgi:hypothetical protein